MLIDTHCHLNMMVKKKFDVLLTEDELQATQPYIKEADSAGVSTIINVGTSLPESINCVSLAQAYKNCFAAIGIHPNDATETWSKDLAMMKKTWFKDGQHRDIFRIIAIGEIGIDRHYPGYNIIRQQDAFRAQIELALEYDLPIIIHTRDAQDETLKIVEEYKQNNIRGEVHCFSEDQAFANEALKLGFMLGIGGTLTYPKSDVLRQVFMKIPLSSILLETDAPFLPPQEIRGKQNTPAQIKTIAQYLASLRGASFEAVAQATTNNARELFKI